MQEAENYCKQTWETKLDILKPCAICILQVCYPGCDIIKSEINLNLFNQAFLGQDQNVKAKT